MKSQKANYGHLSSGLDGEQEGAFFSTDLVGSIRCEEFTGFSNEQKIWILLLTDVYSKFTDVAIITKIISSELIKPFAVFFENIGTPKILLSDRGTQFVSETFQNWLEEKRVKMIHTSPYNPQRNAVSERLNAVIGVVLRIKKEASTQELINSIRTRINCAVSRVSGLSPTKFATVTMRSILGKRLNLNASNPPSLRPKKKENDNDSDSTDTASNTNSRLMTRSGLEIAILENWTCAVRTLSSKRSQ